MLRHQRFQTKNSRNPFPLLLLRVILIGFYLSACTYPSVTPTPGIVPTFVILPPTTSFPTTASPSTSTNTPVIETLTAQASITAVSPTPCGAPVGWVRYTIRPGDSLLSLGVKTNVTVDEIKLTNCLTSDLIYPEDALYLPFTPPTDIPIPPAAVPPSATEVDLCLSIFNCPNSSLDPLTLPSGGSNYTTLRPCTGSTSGPRVDYEGLSVDPPNLDRAIGEQTYFFACDFANPAQLTARITGPGTTIDLKVLDVSLLPNRDLLANSGSAQKVIPWYPICDLPEGSYTITLSDSANQSSSLTLNLIKPGIPMIMVRPQAIRGGEPFDIFYCGYSDVANKAIQFDLFSMIGVNPGGKRAFAHLRSWPVFINSDGWAKQEQSAPWETPENTYYIQDNDGALDGGDLFWVIP